MLPFTTLQCQWGTAGAETKVPSAESSELWEVLSSMPRVGQSIHSLACFACCQEYYPIFTFMVHLTLFFPSPFSTFSLRFTCGPSGRNWTRSSSAQAIDARSRVESPKNIKRLQKSFGWDYKPRVYTHAKRLHTHPVVHVRVRWITETTK